MTHDEPLSQRLWNLAAKPSELRFTFWLWGGLVGFIPVISAVMVATMIRPPHPTNLGIAAVVVAVLLMSSLTDRIMLAVQRRWDRRQSKPAVE